MFTSSFMSPSDRFWAVTFFRPFLLGLSGRFCSASLKRLKPKMLMITEQDQDSKEKKDLESHETTSQTVPQGSSQAPENPSFQGGWKSRNSPKMGRVLLCARLNLISAAADQRKRSVFWPLAGPPCLLDPPLLLLPAAAQAVPPSAFLLSRHAVR